MAGDALPPVDADGFHAGSAPAAADAGLAAEQTLEEDETPYHPMAIPGRNGQHPFSGPLAPLKERAAGRQARQYKRLPIILAIIGGIVILSCLGAGAFVMVNVLAIQNSLNSPQTTLDDFYDALHVKDYAAAYGQLSSGYQSRLTESSFRATFELIGTIASHQVGTIQTQNDQASATVQVVLAQPDGGTVTETKTIQLVQENGNWKIDRVDPSLTRVIWSVGQPLLALDGG